MVTEKRQMSTLNANNHGSFEPSNDKVDDDVNSLVDTSTICTTSESVQLSLPDNFDDAFSINGISIAPMKCANAEFRLLHAQIYDLRSQVKHLTQDRDACLRQLQSLDMNSIFESDHEEIKLIPEGKRSLVQHVSYIIKEKVSKHHDELRTAIDKAKISRDIAAQQTEKASNAQILCDQRIQNLQEALDAANERRKESDEKCKSLHEKIIEIEEKGRKFDDLTSQYQTLEHESNRLRKVIDQRQKEVESTKVENATFKTKVKDLSSQKHSLEMDISFIEKEKALLMKRIEETESRFKHVDSNLRDANARCDDMSLQLGNANAVARAESEEKAAIEIKRIRSECDEELKRYRSQVETSYKRELSILKEAKEEATRKYIEAQSQATKLHNNLDKTTSQKDDAIRRLEKSLSDCQSDVKVKCIESSKLQLCNEQLEHHVKALQSEVQMLSAHVEAHKNEFKNLEQESSHQRKQMMDEIERKNEQLEIYYQSQKMSSVSQEGGKCVQPYVSTDKISAHHFLDKAKNLEKKNSDLLKAIAHLRKEMKKQSEKTTEYQMKLKSAENERVELTKKLNEAMKEKSVENEIAMNLKSINHTLKEKLRQSQKEISRVSNDYSFLMTKYNQLMKSNNENDQNHCCNITPRRRHQNSNSRNVQVWKIDSTTKVATPLRTKTYVGP